MCFSKTLNEITPLHPPSLVRQLAVWLEDRKIGSLFPGLGNLANKEIKQNFELVFKRDHTESLKALYYATKIHCRYCNNEFAANDFIVCDRSFKVTKYKSISHRSTSIYFRDVEAVECFLLPLPIPLEVSCFRVRFRFLILGILCFRFQLRIKLAGRFRVRFRFQLILSKRFRFLRFLSNCIAYCSAQNWKLSVQKIRKVYCL